jgi:hypothetical protein
MTQSKSIEVIKIALGRLVKQGLWDSIPHEPGAIALEVGPMETKCVWRNLEWWEQFTADSYDGTWSLTVDAIATADLETDVVVVARVDSPSETWQVLTIERPPKAPQTVGELLKMQPKS